MKVVVLGSGNVAQAISIAFKESGNEVVEIVARNRDEGSKLAQIIGCGFTSQYDSIAEADLYIIAVCDNAVELVSNKIEVSSNATVAHTAGSMGIETLSKHSNHAILYPLQTFSKGREVDFSQIPILIEGNNPHATKTVEDAAKAISGDVRVVDSEQRRMVHLAAVFACNFTNHMYVLAEQLINESNLDFSVLKPLIMETVNKAIEAQSPRDTQTGPAVRNDFITKSKHCQMLNNQPLLRTLYTNISKNIWEISKKI